MLLLVLGLILFFAIHLVPTIPDMRHNLALRFGENAYKAAFSLLSLAGFALIVLGYHKLQLNPGKNIVLFETPEWTRHIAFLLMVPAMILLVASNVPSRIRTAVKHPMLAATKLWALAHLLVNGDLASLLLFGGFLTFAIYDRISVKRRGALGPLGNRQGGPVNDLIVIAGGLALYAFFLYAGHGWLIGVPLIG
jgi:uncharacterized membrane protein